MLAPLVQGSLEWLIRVNSLADKRISEIMKKKADTRTNILGTTAFSKSLDPTLN